jgi:HrpA-like RNA helicase
MAHLFAPLVVQKRRRSRSGSADFVMNAAAVAPSTASVATATCTDSAATRQEMTAKLAAAAAAPPVVVKKRRRSRSGSADCVINAAAAPSTSAALGIAKAPPPLPPQKGPTIPPVQKSRDSRATTTEWPNKHSLDTVAVVAAQQLPVHALRNEIVQAVTHNPENQVILITASTGSGKSTQIPAYFLHDTKDSSRQQQQRQQQQHHHQQQQRLLLERYDDDDDDDDDHHFMAVTQPRRVAAVTLAQRVGARAPAANATVGRIGTRNWLSSAL